MKMYHSSMIPPEIIKKEGLSRKSKGLTVSGEWAFDLGWYDTNNIIFFSLKPNQFSGDYIYEVDVSGLELLPDYPSLVDSGAYVSEVGRKLSWTRVPSCLRKVAFEGEVVKGDLDDYVDCCVKITKSAAIRAPIAPNRIRLFKQINEQRIRLVNLIFEQKKLEVI